jgi:hypothetical protein
MMAHNYTQSALLRIASFSPGWMCLLHLRYLVSTSLTRITHLHVLSAFAHLDESKESILRENFQLKASRPSISTKARQAAFQSHAKNSAAALSQQLINTHVFFLCVAA